MRFAHAVGVVLSLLLLGAHFLRTGLPIPLLAIALVLLVALIFVRRAWAGGLLQLVLVLGAVEWARTAMLLAGRRAELGEPYGRLLLILGVVVGFTLWTALAFRHPVIARAYRTRREDAAERDRRQLR